MPRRRASSISRTPSPWNGRVYNIRVNAICPGYIETEMNSDFWKTPGGQRLIERIPQRRIGQPEHLDGALLLLASEAGTFMTGSVLTVDGGHTVSSL